MDTNRRASETTAGAAGRVIGTPMGWVCVIVRMGRLVASSLPMTTAEAAIAACPAAADFSRPDALLDAVCCDLRRYFSGEPVNLSQYPVDLSQHPPFHRRALLAARRIPYGQVRTYAWVASGAGSPKAARAAGQALAHNTLPLFIPCHRVVASGRKLGGFGGGPELKRALLVLEGVPCCVTSRPG